MTQGDLLTFAIRTLERLRIDYMVVGSLTSAAYGEPRFTRDIDIVVDLRPERVQELCDAFGADEFYVSREAAQTAVAQRGQFNVMHPASGNKVDFLIARVDAWGEEQLRRKQKINLMPDLGAYAARPEDIIIGKMIYYQEGGSEKHLRDIAGILKTTGAEVDRVYVDRWSEQLGLTAIWKAVQERAAGRQDQS